MTSEMNCSAWFKPDRIIPGATSEIACSVYVLPVGERVTSAEGPGYKGRKKKVDGSQYIDVHCGVGCLAVSCKETLRICKSSTYNLGNGGTRVRFGFRGHYRCMWKEICLGSSFLFDLLCFRINVPIRVNINFCICL